MADPPVSPRRPAGAARRPAVHAAEVYCDACGQETEHRVLRLDQPGAGADAAVQGLARCRACGLTHRFRSEPEREVEVAEVLSEGRVSVAGSVRLPAHQRLQIGSDVPGHRHRIRRLETRAGRDVGEARADEVATIWATRQHGARVAVSLVQGRRTRSLVLEMPEGAVLEVGGPLSVEGRAYRIRALRAAGQTLHHEGASFPAHLVQRVYAGRATSPPAGSSAWSRDREMPSAPASSTSSTGRSRSSPGDSRYRTRPRARSAAGGDAHQSVRP